MAQISALLTTFGTNGSITLVYNDANGNVASVTCTNNNAAAVRVNAWVGDGTAKAGAAVVQPGQTQTYNNLANAKYWPTELPEGDPRRGNIGYTLEFPYTGA